MISVEKIINKLIFGTKSNKYKWFYLSDKGRSIVDICDNFVTYYDYQQNTLNTSDSFILNFNEGYLALCEDSYSNLLLIVIPSLDSKDIQCINNYLAPDFQQELLRLQNLIKKQFPNVEDFLNEFMDEN
ncbi:hypothetical protein [Clostridium oceanicum]|uniref:Uncharacterized protein n=1 Tax=Clostridium oceanicum TaxID=1543 RepID=A0ABN1JC54_9CLOT